MMQEALHHHYRRKRADTRAYPWWARGVDWVVYPMGVLGLLMAIPQTASIWVYHETAGVSVFSWTAWTLISAFWTLFGILHKEKPIIWINGAWVIANALVALGAVIYS